MKPSPLGRFLGMVAVVWLLSWVPIGFYVGDLDYALTPVSRDTGLRQLYQILFYAGLLAVFVDAWRRHAPERPGWGSWAQAWPTFALGLAGALFSRFVYWTLEARPAVTLVLTTQKVVIALVSVLAVAVVEEAVFRGFFFGRLAARTGFLKGALISSALFAVVHLFRPGGLGFKLGYFVGLFLLGMMLAQVAWRSRSVLASAGLHGGLILPNLLDPWTELEQSWWSGWQQEPLSGVLGWVLMLGLWDLWRRLFDRRRSTEHE